MGWIKTGDDKGGGRVQNEFVAFGYILTIVFPLYISYIAKYKNNFYVFYVFEHLCTHFIRISLSLLSILVQKWMLHFLVCFVL